uniref:replication protein n=1 Tax=Gilliamella sp. Nev6-6 TaxID=3120252 RepID=UPI001179BBE8|nr:replication protein [Gilliamella apicola]
MSTAKVIDFQPREGRMANLDDGYTRIANDLLEKIISFPFTLRQQNLLLSIARKTYGYNKKIDWIGNKQLSELTGYPETRCSTIKNELIKMDVLVTKGREVGINKNLGEWKSDITQTSKTFTKSVKKTFTKTVNHSLPKEVNTKDNTTKDNKDNNILLDSAFEIFYKAGLPKVGKSKAITSFKTAYKNWKSENKTPEVFAQMLAGDIQCRLKANIFGFANLHPTTYLNQSRWEDELPANARRSQSQMTPEQQREYDLYMFMQGDS